MKKATRELDTLFKQIKEYSLQISNLSDLLAAATARVSHHLEESKPGSSHLMPILQPQEAETKRSPLYIWENIGEGG